MKSGEALHGQARRCTGSESACGACQWTLCLIGGEDQEKELNNILGTAYRPHL